MQKPSGKASAAQFQQATQIFKSLFDRTPRHQNPSHDVRTPRITLHYSRRIKIHLATSHPSLQKPSQPIQLHIGQPYKSWPGNSDTKEGPMKNVDPQVRDDTRRLHLQVMNPNPVQARKSPKRTESTGTAARQKEGLWLLPPHSIPTNCDQKDFFLREM